MLSTRISKKKLEQLWNLLLLILFHYYEHKLINSVYIKDQTQAVFYLAIEMERNLMGMGSVGV